MTPGEAFVSQTGPVPATHRRIHRSMRRWRRAFLSLLLAIPTLGLVGAGDGPMIVLVAVTLLLIGGVMFLALSLTERLFRGGRAR